ncbi:Mce family protein [Rhodococcus sp. RS1C4]|uniref:MCE family protein n=1 Tax=Rhodococcus sp. 114MFTsu3.1 TaxID=1172184 RepID=UPI000382EF9E|nr:MULTISPECIES: MCE family protein [unclassified Rhodococcus (in: high G+C Gram-positive bacteria)]OZC46728.1 Mce family protein [Rhodococcus sp. 06-621-2]OZC52877.1 Mce family protein [Rhodococcus sp. RS1C4]OZC77413.1 Mce family protein [Rhodococcus sp. 06-418-1B]OZC77776.1 Mce family protein [Rhodococcus sp. 06-418-1B]
MTSLARPMFALAAFAVAGLLSAVVVVDTLSVPVSGETRSHTAEFTGVEGLRTGNDVTLAGVRIGKVDDVRYEADGARTIAVVDFDVQTSVPIPGNVTAAIRYGDMLGARYLALVPPEDPAGTLDSTIPLDRTSPPVDLTALVNGFKPLFDAIEPSQVNALARSITDAFQGEAGTVDSLLRHVAGVTRGLANNDQIFSDLIADLDAVLQTMNSHDADITRLITGLTDMSRVVADRNDSLITLLDDGSTAVAALAELATDASAPLDGTVADLRATTRSWIPNTEQFDRTMTLLPELASSINSIGDYGGWLNLYTCNFTLKAGDAETNIFGDAHTEICR